MPGFGQARGVQIDSDPRMVGMRYPYEINLIGDAAATLRALIPLLEPAKDHDWREWIEEDVAAWWTVMERQERVSANPINPQLVVGELSRRLPEGALVTSDSGSAANWYARHLRFRADTRGSLSGTLATMGPGVPYAIGAKFGCPDRLPIALVGDGAMQMNGINELITIAKYWPSWSDPRLVIAVFNNRDLNQVSWEMRAMQGAPQFLPSQQLPDFPYAEYARSLGLGGIRVDAPEDVGGAWDRALAADGPTLLEFVTDPAIPPIPPHATWEEARNMLSAVPHGDSDRWNVIKEGFKTKLRELMPTGEVTRR
jgi:pyruvate dehydrogenase (quinone)